MIGEELMDISGDQPSQPQSAQIPYLWGPLTWERLECHTRAAWKFPDLGVDHLQLKRALKTEYFQSLALSL